MLTPEHLSLDREWSIKNTGIDPELPYENGIVTISHDPNLGYRVAFKCDDIAYAIDCATHNKPACNMWLPESILQATKRANVLYEGMRRVGLFPQFIHRNNPERSLV